MTDLEIFHNAPDDASFEELAAYLEEACGDDVELRARVDALFAFSSRTDDYLEQAAVDLEAPTIGPGGKTSGKSSPYPPKTTPRSGYVEPRVAVEQSGDKIGPFTLIEKLGEGGFGSVWKASQKVPIARTVALKVIKLGMDTREVLTRFEAERQALAMMDHQHIAKVLDAGATEAGRPYFVMELVDGVPITRYCDQHQLTTRQRLELFRDVCSAVNHAHQKGMIHRDIKPSNVLVAAHDGKAVIKVIDFGIAKATGAKLTEETIVTLQEQIIGTPAYMSPEQAGMGGLDIDTRSDIYSLGALLYELLSGKPPFDPRTLLSAGLMEMRRIVREVEPPRPSYRVSTVLSDANDTAALTTSHGVDPNRLSRTLRGELDWIVMKAIEKDRNRRYETANAFAADIGRFLANEPVSAAAPSFGYQFQKFARRNQVALAVGATIAAVLVLATIISALQAIRANRAQNVAEERSEELRHQLYDSDMMLASQALDRPSGLTSALAINEKWTAKEGEEDRRGWEWYFHRSSELANTQTFHFPSEEETVAIVELKWFPDSRRFLAMAGSRLMIWDFATRMRLARIENQGALGRAVAISPEGDRLAVAWDNDEVTIHSTEKGDVILRFASRGEVGDLVWREEANQLVTAGKDGLAFWDAKTGEAVGSVILLPIDLLPTFSPDGDKLAFVTTGGEASIQVVQTASGEAIHNSKKPDWWHLRRIRWNPSSESLGIQGVYGRTYLVDLKAEDQRIDFNYSGYDMAWLPDGKSFAWAQAGGRVIEYRVASDPTMVVDYWNTGGDQAHLLSCSPDGRWLLSSEEIGQQIRAWPLDPGARVPMAIFKARPRLKGMTWPPLDKRPAAGEFSIGWNRTVPGTRTMIDFWWCIEGVASADWHPDGSRLAVLNGDRSYELEIWSEETGLVEHQKQLEGSIRHVEWNHDGSRLAIWSHMGYWMVCDGSSFRELWRIPQLQASGTWLPKDQGLLLSKDWELWIADSETGRTKRKIISRPEVTRARETVNLAKDGRFLLAVSPDGSLLACGSTDQTVTIWDTHSWEKIRTLWIGESVWSVEWSPSGDRLAVGTAESIRIWNPSRGSEVLKISGKGADILHWSPDGTMIATGIINDANAYLWDTRPARRAETLEQFHEAVDGGRWPQAEAAAKIGLTTYQRSNDDPWFHAGWWKFLAQLVSTNGPEGEPFTVPSAFSLPPGSWAEADTEADGVLVADVTDGGPSIYVSRYFSSAEAPLAVVIDIDSPGRIWHEGELILDRPETPIGRAELTLKLVAGWNDFVVQPIVKEPGARAELQLRLKGPGDPDAAFLEHTKIEGTELNEETRRAHVLAAVKESPASAHAWRNLTRVELHHDRLDQAEPALREAFALAPLDRENFGLLVALLDAQSVTKGSEAEPVVMIGRIIHAAETGLTRPLRAGSDSILRPSSDDIELALNALASWLPAEVRIAWKIPWQEAFGDRPPSGKSGREISAAWYRRAWVHLFFAEREEGLNALKACTEQSRNEPPSNSKGKIVSVGDIPIHVDQILEIAVEEMMHQFLVLAEAGRSEEANTRLSQAFALQSDPTGSDLSRTRRNLLIQDQFPDHSGRLRHCLGDGDIAGAEKIAASSLLLYDETRLAELKHNEAFLTMDHQQTGYAMIELARAIGGKNRFEDALLLREAALRIAQLNPDSGLGMHVNLALGSDYARKGRYEDSIRARETALPRSRADLGEDHNITLSLIRGLAEVYENLGHLDESIRYGEELVVLLEKSRGPDNGETVSAKKSLVRVYKARGDVEKAEAMQNSLPLTPSIPSPQATGLPADLRLAIESAVTFAHQGKLDEAASVWTQVGPKIDALPPATRLKAIAIFRQISSEFTKKRVHPEETLAIIQTFLEASTLVNGPEHEQTGYGKLGLAEYFASQERDDEAIALRHEVIDLAAKRGFEGLGLYARHGMAFLYKKAERYAEATEIYEAIYPIARKLRGPDDLMTRGILLALMDALGKSGRYDESITRGEELVELETRLSGLNDSRTRDAIRRLIEAYQAAGREDEANRLREKMATAIE